jgi:hypothetical protein
MEKKVDTQLNVIQADQNMLIQLELAPNKEFHSEICFDPSEARAKLLGFKTVEKCIQALQSAPPIVAKVNVICQDLEAQGLKESELLAELEKKIAALKEKAIEDELEEA